MQKFLGDISNKDLSIVLISKIFCLLSQPPPLKNDKIKFWNLNDHDLKDSTLKTWYHCFNAKYAYSAWGINNHPQHKEFNWKCLFWWDIQNKLFLSKNMVFNVTVLWGMKNDCKENDELEMTKISKILMLKSI